MSTDESDHCARLVVETLSDEALEALSDTAVREVRRELRRREGEP
jgi:hypothetical protein